MTNQMTDGIQDFQQQLQNFQAAEDPKQFPPLAPSDTIIKGRLIEEPQPPEALITYEDRPMLTRGCVGGIVAAGGIGKTIILIELATMMASGGSLGPLKAPKPLNVLLLIGEDPQDELDRRLWRVCKGNFTDSLYATSVAGKIGPIMQIDNGNPARSKWYEWLRKTIENHPGLDVLIIDPKSRFYGLDENNNDHCTQWISALESLATEYNITILFAHHVSKSLGDDLHQNMSRGGSALADGVRWLVGMTPMDEGTAKKYGVSSRNYIKMDLVKANYVAKLPKTIFFKRDDLGVLHYEELEHVRLNKMAQFLCDLICQESNSLTRRDLRRDSSGKEITDKMKEEFSKFNRSKDMDACLDYALKQGWLEENDIGTSKNPKKIIKVRSTLI